MSDPSPTLGLVAAVHRAAGALRRRGDIVARTVGQSQARWQVLSVLSGKEYWTAPRIGYELGISRQAVQRIVDELLSDGLVRPLRNPYHRRSTIYQLTDEGRAALAAITDAAAPWDAEADAVISPEDAAAALRVLR